MKTYTADNAEDMVIVHDNGSFSTFTRGTKDALYIGEDVEAARTSLQLSKGDWSRLLASDAEEE